MIKIVASIDDCGNKKTKQFSTAKNRDITMNDVSKLGFTIDDIYECYQKKNKVNFERLKNGY